MQMEEEYEQDFISNGERTYKYKLKNSVNEKSLSEKPGTRLKLSASISSSEHSQVSLQEPASQQASPWGAGTDLSSEAVSWYLVSPDFMLFFLHKINTRMSEKAFCLLRAQEAQQGPSGQRCKA